MQNTRLNNLVDLILERGNQWLQNPWRRTSLVVISLLFGNFFATAISTVSGQKAEWDIVVSLVLVIFTEGTSWIVYRNRPVRIEPVRIPQRTLFLEMLNAFKLGLVYGMFVEAFKIGS
jgi:hypothetical protein